MSIPENLYYTKEHEWVAPTPESRLRVGITEYAQKALGDIVFVELRNEGTHVTVGDSLGEVESTKSVSDVYAPATGVVAARNPKLAQEPESVNHDPYGDGWLVELALPEDVTVKAITAQLLDAKGYAEIIRGDTRNEVDLG